MLSVIAIEIENSLYVTHILYIVLHILVLRLMFRSKSCFMIFYDIIIGELNISLMAYKFHLLIIVSKYLKSLLRSQDLLEKSQLFL